MKFALIGTGNMAWFLANRLTRSGHECSYIYGRNPESARELALASRSRAAAEPMELHTDEDAVIFAVSDSQIAALAAPYRDCASVLVHTAGALSRDLFQSPHHGVFWPVYSIRREQIPTHRDIPCIYEGNDARALQVIGNLVHGFTDAGVEGDIRLREWLHLAAVFVNNFTTHLLAIGGQIASEHQVPMELLRPLIRQTFERLEQGDAAAMQTGPARRGDLRTLTLHRNLLTARPSWLDLYNAFSQSIAELHGAPPAPGADVPE